MERSLETQVDYLVSGAAERRVPLTQLHDLALARPELSDKGLRAEIKERHGVELSRRSITQY